MERNKKTEHANRKFEMMKAMRFDPEVSASSCEVMCALLEFTSHDQPCVPSMNRLAIDLGCDEKTVERGLKGHCFNVNSLKHWDKTVPDGPIYFVRVRTGFKKPYRYVPVDDRVIAMLKELKLAVGIYKKQFQSTDEDSLTDSEIRGDNLGGSSTPNPVPSVPPNLSVKQVSINSVSITSEGSAYERGSCVRAEEQNISALTSFTESREREVSYERKTA
ncbi:MAG: hypothetical protein MnENMB40S_28730 [Rhizobiaceae bacterium MnEN-MB40S]|nr:MAG: hypothetical protein MnENMB40S_28730 [Rhizobiaceae bacterium MnEN-MB40S]